MPNIPTYSSEQPVAQANNMVEEAFLRQRQNAARIGGAISDLADTGLGVMRRIEENRALEESTTLAADLATTQADLQVKLEEAKKNADPNSEDFKDWAANFNSTVVDPAVDKLGSGLTTRQAQRQLKETQAKLRGMFYVKTNADQADLSGVAAVDNIKTLGNVQAASVYANPATFDISIGIIDHSIQGLVDAGLPLAQANEIKRDLHAQVAESAFRSAAELNPDKAQKDLDAGRYAPYLPEGKQEVLRGYVETQRKAADLARRQKAADEAKAKKDAAEASETAFTSRLITEPTKVDPKEIARDPTLSGEQKRVLFDFQEKRLKPESNELKTDNGLYMSLFDRIHLPDGDPRKITDESSLNQYFGRGLNATSLGQLRGEISGRRTQEGAVEADLKKEFITKARRKITATNELLGMRDPKGDDLLYQFMQSFLPSYDAAVRKGGNPVELLAPGGAFDKMVEQSTRPLSVQMRDIIYDAGVGAAPGTPAAPSAAPPKAPTRPTQIPPSAKFSPSTKEWWWQEGGVWKKAPAAIAK